MQPEIYKDIYGVTFRFNDPVKCVTISMFKRQEVVGRLVQVRLGCGQFGSDLFFLRLPDNGLMTFENEMIRPYFGEIEIPINPADSVEEEYYINKEWPATGFIITDCKRPQPVGFFSMMMMQPEPKPTNGHEHH